MRFVCDSCRAQYMISDDKVGAKGVKVRCKKCGFVILVRRTEAATELAETQVMTSPVVPEPASAPSQPAGGGDLPFGGGEDSLFAGADDEIGAMFDQVLSGGSQSPAPSDAAVPPDDDEVVQTRVVDASAMQKLAAETAERDDDDKTQMEAAPVAAHEWYAAIDDKQQGPFSLEKMKELCSRGEVGPDSLCWRAGFSDWLPLSEISELTSVLSPRPAKPVISAATSVAPASAAVVDQDDDGGSADGGGDWQPSAASALASLVKDEIEALTRPAAKSAVGAQAGGAQPLGGSMSGSLLGGAAGGLLGLSEPAPAPSAPSLIPSVPPSEAASAPVAPRAAIAPVMESAPAQAKPAPFVPAPYGYGGASSSKKGLIIGLSVGGVVVIALLLTVVYLLGRDTGGDRVPAQVAHATQPVQPPTAAPPAQTTPPPPPVQVAAQTPPANPPVATATPPSQAPAAVTPPAQTPPKSVEAPPPEAKQELAKADPPPEEPHRSRHNRHSSQTREQPVSAAAEAPSPPPKQAKASGGTKDDFDTIFGGGDDSPPAAPARDSSRHKSVYVPPAPGSAEIPDSLSQGDIMQVVISNKPSIARCVQEQKKTDPDLSGRMVVRWTILTSGRTSGVSVRSSEFKSTHMASCITGLIRGMRFPRHKQQGAPIDFPFTF